jgi:hypothetical protein
MAARKVKTVSISKTAQESKADTGSAEAKSIPIGSLGAGQSSIQIVKESKMSAEINISPSEELDKTRSTPDFDNAYVRVGGRRVKESFLNSVWNHVSDRLELFQFGVAYTGNQICGDLFWNRLSSDEEKFADLCICDLIEHGDLPMGKIATSPNGSPQYCLIYLISECSKNTITTALSNGAAR